MFIKLYSVELDDHLLIDPEDIRIVQGVSNLTPDEKFAGSKSIIYFKDTSVFAHATVSESPLEIYDLIRVEKNKEKE